MTTQQQLNKRGDKINGNNQTRLTKRTEPQQTKPKRTKTTQHDEMKRTIAKEHRKIKQNNAKQRDEHTNIKQETTSHNKRKT